MKNLYLSSLLKYAAVIPPQEAKPVKSVNTKISAGLRGAASPEVAQKATQGSKAGGVGAAAVKAGKGLLAANKAVSSAARGVAGEAVTEAKSYLSSYKDATDKAFSRASSAGKGLLGLGNTLRRKVTNDPTVSRKTLSGAAYLE